MQVTAWQHDQDEHKTVLGPGAYSRCSNLLVQNKVLCTDYGGS